MLFLFQYSNFRSVRKRSAFRRQAGISRFAENKKEIMLLRTIAITILVFIFCWSGYAAVILTDPSGIDPYAKKVSITNFYRL